MIPPKSQGASSWTVLKFGGTSVGKFLREICEVVGRAQDGTRVAVVCSARSADVKACGTTSRLLRASEQVQGKERLHTKTVKEILQDHLASARSMIRSPEVLENLEKHLRTDCSALESFLDALFILKEVSPKNKDVIVGTGERLACRLVTAALLDQGYSAEMVSLESVCSSDFSSLEQPFYDHLSVHFQEAVEKCSASIPVLTGFFGAVPGGLLNSIGRGYSDLTAALVAVGLEAKELQIWKEVDGVFTADPRKVKSARLLPSISPDETAELTYYGSEVIHPFTMGQVMRATIPIRILNVQNPFGQGSLILPSDKVAPPGQHPTAVTVKDNITLLDIRVQQNTAPQDFLNSLFSILDSHDITVDLIHTSDLHVKIAIPSSTVLQPTLKELNTLGKVLLLEDMYILTLVGKHMRSNRVGIATQIISTLKNAKIHIEMLSKGTSDISISCLFHQKHSLFALNEIHRDLLEWD